MTNTVDPVGGADAIETMTDELERGVFQQLEMIERLGGMLSAIETGWIQSQIQEAAYAYQRSIETKERIIVGVNQFQLKEDEAVPLHSIDPEVEPLQISRLHEVRSRRDGGALAESLSRLEAAARSEENLLPHIVRAVSFYATVGEISDVFRKVHGEYREALVS